MKKKLQLKLFLLKRKIAFYRYKNKIDKSKVGKIKKLVILGNSIVWHVAAPELGWNGNWGMAASKQENDFVHVLKKKIDKQMLPVDITYQNIAEFERHFDTFDLTTLEKFRNADMLIVKISENIDASKAEKDDLIKYYRQLIDYLNENKSTVVVICEGFWDKPYVNNKIKDFAIHNNYTFAQLSDLEFVAQNKAFKFFENKDVGNHPSDTGMNKIAGRIWHLIKDYF